MGSDSQEVKNRAKYLIKIVKTLGYKLMNQKPKYMEIFRHDNHREHLDVISYILKGYKFEKVHSFKYLSVTMHSTNNK